jgi:N-acetylneuraminate synthase
VIEIVAEVGINHNGDMDVVKRLIGLAAQAGCNYVKFQKRTPEKCVPKHMWDKERDTPWGKMRYIEYRKRIELSRENYEMIDGVCSFNNIRWFASVWDLESAEFMRDMGCRIVKIPSALITDGSLLRYCSNCFSVVIISTGMSTEEEIEYAVEQAKPAYILHTHSAYPAPINELDLTYMYHLKKKYPKRIIGYSGHEYGLVPTFAAAALGAQMIERHITLDRTMWGSDQVASVEPAGLFKLVKGIRAIELAIAHKQGPTGTETTRVLWPSELPKRDALRG